jgi:hypothetical protein
MDVIGAAEGEDKSSVIKFRWDYLRQYEQIFAALKDRPINLIEVGVAGGSSLRVWQWYFTAARIIGIDITPSAKRHEGGRVSIEIGSQADGDFLRRICQAHPPTIIIDDGSHLAEHNIFTFEHVFPMLLPGALYIVEDLAFHFGPSSSRWQGQTTRNAPEYFLDLARCCMARKLVPGTERLPPHIWKMVDSVMFVGSAAIIRKRRTRRDVGRALELGNRYLSKARRGAKGYERLAAYGAMHGGLLSDIERAAQTAAAQGSRALSTRCIHADVLLRTDRPAEAMRVLIEAFGAPADRTAAQQALADMLGASGLTQGSIAKLRALLEQELGRTPAHRLLAVLASFKPGVTS